MLVPDGKFERMYEQYFQKVCRFLAQKVGRQTAEDIAQFTFVKAMEHFHTFRGECSEFTWLCQIANNSLKNEYRRKHRNLETSVHMSDAEHRFVTVEFTEHVELRIDVAQALVALHKRDRDIISLHYDVGCTLKEVADLVGMRESAVKNRLYRALAKLRNELNGRELHQLMTMMDNISVIGNNKRSHSERTAERAMYQDLIEELGAHVDRICLHLKHRPSKRLTIEVYPDLPSFHQAVGEPEAPNWFMGVVENNTIKIASPLNPGPSHTYRSILKATVHLFTMWLVKDLNPYTPKWLYQGLGGYEAGLMTPAYVHASVKALVKQGNVPTFAELEDNTWDFETKQGFPFSYLLCEYVVQRFGWDALRQLIRTPNSFEAVCSLTSCQIHDQWKQTLLTKLSG